MATYQGEVSIVTFGGVKPMYASLTSCVDALGIESWFGVLLGTRYEWAGGGHCGDELMLRLPDGRRGQVVVTGRSEGNLTEEAEVYGLGPRPF